MIEPWIKKNKNPSNMYGQFLFYLYNLLEKHKTNNIF